MPFYTPKLDWGGVVPLVCCGALLHLNTHLFTFAQQMSPMADLPKQEFWRQDLQGCPDQCFRWFWCRLTLCKRKRSSSGSVRETAGGDLVAALSFTGMWNVTVEDMSMNQCGREAWSWVNFSLCIACIHICIIYTVKYILYNVSCVRITYNAHYIL